jgi:hypothetical protein
VLFVDWYVLTVSEEITASIVRVMGNTINASIIRTIALMMETVRASETSVYFNETTLRYIPEALIFKYERCLV